MLNAYTCFNWNVNADFIGSLRKIRNMKMTDQPKTVKSTKSKEITEIIE